MGTTFQQFQESKREVPNLGDTLGFEPGDAEQGFTPGGAGMVYAVGDCRFGMEIDDRTKWGRQYRVTLGHVTHVSHEPLTLERLAFQWLVSDGAIKAVEDFRTVRPDVHTVHAYLADGDIIESAMCTAVMVAKTHFGAPHGSAAFWKSITDSMIDALLDRGYEGDHNAFFAECVLVARHVRHKYGATKLPAWLAEHTEIAALIERY